MSKNEEIKENVEEIVNEEDEEVEENLEDNDQEESRKTVKENKSKHSKRNNKHKSKSKNKLSKSKKSKEKTESSKKKKVLIIVSMIAVVVIIASFIAFFSYKSYQENKSVGSTWGDTYYNFIKETKSSDNKELKLKNDSEISFIEVENIDDPVMVVNYEKNDEEYSDIYFIKNEKVNNIVSLESSEVEMLYNLSSKEYDWYMHTEVAEEDHYKTISTIINDKIAKKDKKENEDNKEENSQEFIYKVGDEISVEKVDGTKITMPKFDSEFVKVDIDLNSIDYNTSLTEKELKAEIKTGVDKYKSNDEITTKNVKKEVTEKVEEINAKKEEMKKAEEEVQKKKEEEQRKAEEERKKAEEEAKKGLKVGNYTLKYGTYAGEPDGPTAGMNFVLKPNGQCEYDGKACTYTIGSHDFAQDVSTAGNLRPCLVINGEYIRHLFPYNSSTIGDGDIESYTYTG